MDFVKARRKIIKRKSLIIKKRKLKNKHGAKSVESTLDCLPKEIMGEVLDRVAASSIFDVLRCKLSYKTFHELSEEKYFLQRVPVESLVSLSWWTKENNPFIERCLESNNSEAILYVGMKQYFSYMMLEEGLKNLEKSAHLGNKMADYMLGLIYLCSGEKQCMKRGSEMLMNISRMNGGKGIVECRKKFRYYRDIMWFQHMFTIQSMPKFSCEMQKQHNVRSRWLGNCYDDEKFEDRLVCETCRCAREVEFFKAVILGI